MFHLLQDAIAKIAYEVFGTRFNIICPLLSQKSELPQKAETLCLILAAKVCSLFKTSVKKHKKKILNYNNERIIASICI